MKTLFIEARKNIQLDKEKLKELEKLLPETIYIAYSIQFKKLAEQVRKELKGRKILGFSQAIGCSEIRTKAKAVLLIGEARFHALNLASVSEKPVYIFDNHSTNKISKEEVEAMKRAEKGKYLKFLASENIGILISTKPGQNKSELALKIKKTLEKKAKKVFLFITDNVNIQELENFPDIEIWINTACPGLALDSNKIINHSAIKTKIIKT